MVPKITLLLLILSTLGSSAGIVFTIQGVGTGTVDTASFTNEPFTFTVATDTTLISAFTDNTGFQTPSVSGAGISIGGLGSGSFTDAEDIFVSNPSDLAGFTNNGTSVAVDLLDGVNAAFATYDLQASIGPLPMTALEGLDQFVDIPTSLGSVTFTAASSVLFTATTAAVATSEPGTLFLLAVAGALLLAGIKLRTRADRSRVRS